MRYRVLRAFILGISAACVGVLMLATVLGVMWWTKQHLGPPYDAVVLVATCVLLVGSLNALIEWNIARNERKKDR